MRNTSPRTYVLKPPPPVRALAIASVGAVTGAALVVLSRAAGLPAAVVVIGWVLLVAALLLAVAALILTVRLRSTITLDGAGLQLRRGSQVRVLPWADITAVELTASHIVLRTRTGGPAEVPNLRGASDPTVVRMLTTVREALDADRGYREPTER